ncbi:iron-containing alcohol dehydrogenase [Armatimonas sp.]|uniref:iron-containing alcohol dehydrogenase n=1 Tax=Armatimonas sp. TaxID=1872638 RepID=UPI00374DCD9E
MIHGSALRCFEVPSTVLHGGGCRSQLPALVRELGGTRVLVVTDPGVVQRGVAGEIVSLLTPPK